MGGRLSVATSFSNFLNYVNIFKNEWLKFENRHFTYGALENLVWCHRATGSTKVCEVCPLQSCPPDNSPDSRCSEDSAAFCRARFIRDTDKWKALDTCFVGEKKTERRTEHLQLLFLAVRSGVFKDVFGH